jgi:hypothetical protein
MRKLAVVVLALSALTLVAVPAGAQTEAHAVFQFDGDANLPRFPCSPPDTCNGNFGGTIRGTFRVGTNVVADQDGGINANFSYLEPAATCPVQGTANGSFNFSGTGAAGGTYSGSGSFSWNRVGASAVITLSNLSLTVNGASASGGIGAATAEFDAPPEAALCSGSAITALVVGKGAAAA